jgi:hypothetical protein
MQALLHAEAGAVVRGAALALPHVLAGIRVQDAREHLIDEQIKVVTLHSRHP